ncbi:MAG TPA: AAA family ATPase [Gemmatimonadales bacterium]
MEIVLPTPSLLLLVGPSGCGKSTFARRHFAPTEIVSSDHCRALVADDPADQGATAGAFAVLHAIVDQRLAHARQTVVDATNLRDFGRAPLLDLARRHHLPAVAIAFDLPAELCRERAAARPDRPVDADVVARHVAELPAALAAMRGEPFRSVTVLRAVAEVDHAEVRRVPLPPLRREERGPFDIVGDVHGCREELEALLARLGYAPDADGAWRHAQGRRLVFVGDLADRGPDVAGVFRIVMPTVEAGAALCVPGNHDDKLMRKLRGRNVVVAHGLQESLDSLAAAPRSFSRRVADFLGALPSHLVLDDDRLVVAHAGMRADLQGRDSRRVRDFALYGDTTGEVDELGLPVRRDWASEYHGRRTVVYGHTPVSYPIWVNRTIDIDTGCVFGGRLTALRYPELTLVHEQARRAYATTRRPFLAPGTPDAPDVSGVPVTAR